MLLGGVEFERRLYVHMTMTMDMHTTIVGILSTYRRR
jgi:hypothetical protein